MMPDQSQGACQAIEDAAAIGLVFSKKHFNGDIRESLKVFEEVRKPRATKVQAASARARENINERIGEILRARTCVQMLTMIRRLL
jgi:salicylate hydroxylase